MPLLSEKRNAAPNHGAGLHAGPDTVETEWLDLAAQLPLPHVFEFELLGHLTRPQQGLRHQHTTLQRAALRLDPSGRVDSVTAVDDILLDIADLRGNDRTAVEASLEFGDDPIPYRVRYRSLCS